MRLANPFESGQKSWARAQTCKVGPFDDQNAVELDHVDNSYTIEKPVSESAGT